jgi:hypothetical protein
MAVRLDSETIHRAWEKNLNEAGNFYYHPLKTNIIKKCIDLRCRKPLCERELTHERGSSEKWLEAYIIQLAKRRNHYQDTLELAGDNYRFLFSQLMVPVARKKTDCPLDCLLYNPETGNLVVLELKATRALTKAVTELDDYTAPIRDAKNDIARVFDLKHMPKVEGYIVWPESKDEKVQNRTYDLSGWGLIQYYDDEHRIIKNGKLVQPWKKFESLDKDLTMTFTKVQPCEKILS